MRRYEYYRANIEVIGIRLTKSTFKDVLELIANHRAVEKYTASSDDCKVCFTQGWPNNTVLELKYGMYLTSENSRLGVYSAWEFRNKFSRVHSMPSYYTPTGNEVKVLECLNRDSEMCYGYSYICAETGLSRTEAKESITRLRELGAVEYWRGLMTEDGEVAGSGFCWGDPDKAEALLYRALSQ